MKARLNYSFSIIFSSLFVLLFLHAADSCLPGEGKASQDDKQINNQCAESANTEPGFFETIIEKINFSASDSKRIKKKFKNTFDKIKSTDYKKIWNDGYKKFNEFIEQQETQDPGQKRLHNNRSALKHFLKELSDRKLVDRDKTLNQYVRDFLIKSKPELEGTDIGENPLNSIYYYLALDPAGFIENVRIVKGPMGAPMTLKEAYEYYYRTDPEKAAKILKLLKTFQKLTFSKNDSQSLTEILKALKTNLELINGE